MNAAPAISSDQLCRSLLPPDARISAQARWARISVHDRLRPLANLRHLIAEHADSLAAAAASVSRRPVAEKLVSEVLPLAEACHWLVRHAGRVLAPQRHGWLQRPIWLPASRFKIQRQPFGRLLVIGPGNYPLFLPAIHCLHALAAGNAVRLKPAPGTRHVAAHFARLAFEAGLDPALLEVLDDSTAAAQRAMLEGADKVIFTGSSATGRTILTGLAATNTPSVMELSGEDPVLILPDADLQMVSAAVRFGQQFNAGNTCIAPRRIIGVGAIAAQLAILFPDFAVEPAGSEADAIALINAAPYGLGAAIFSRDLPRARRIAAQLRTGFVTVNDLIVPTADPRLPFCGVKGSGFGVTRGAEGLLEMTYPQVVTVRHGVSRPHFAPSTSQDAGLFSSFIRLLHGRNRLSAAAQFLRAACVRLKTTPHP